MRNFTKLMMIGLAVIFTLPFLGSNALGMGAGYEKGSASEPPYGLAIQGDASGERLIGEISIENYLCSGDYATSLAAVVRLRKGTSAHPDNFYTYYVKLNCSISGGLSCSRPCNCDPYSSCYNVTEPDDVRMIQDAITNALKDTILYDFFGDTNRSLVLRAVDDYGWTYSDDWSSLIGLGDIEVASKKQ
jgi:hypothetical protein